MRHASKALKAAIGAHAALLVCSVQPALAEGLRDPMQPPIARTAKPHAAPQALRLEAILVDGERRIAVVDGKVVRAGERVGAAVITAIGADRIEYSRDGRTHTATLRRTDKLTAAPDAAGLEDDI